MELRLIHGVAYSEPWFGRWGYKFGRASFCVTQQMYQKAIEALQGMPLCLLIHDHLATSNHEFLSSSQELKSRLPPTDQNSCIDSSYNPAMLVETNCRWSPKKS
ncbi:PHD finger protein MALE STERILITY 1 [Prunus yedoensis var. nudiflora]|uniref:PHD finger protein MALE STERILITY 1 n=1 Tax=Prunus yedoensis var. nudiflora TaxID=2094558 RepID=A0A314XUY1_PRUYE|nr:PHD finger protein MALE STERILITY 1 [Prunus yedoensis var. nudiflora]